VVSYERTTVRIGKAGVGATGATRPPSQSTKPVERPTGATGAARLPANQPTQPSRIAPRAALSLAALRLVALRFAASRCARARPNRTVQTEQPSQLVSVSSQCAMNLHCVFLRLILDQYVLTI